jgi:hypothetical protein
MVEPKMEAAGIEPAIRAPGEISCLTPLRGKGPRAYELGIGGLDTPCWLWLGALNSKGYAIRGTQHERYLVHRRAWEEVNGPIPDGKQIHHLCRNRRCVRPSHLAVLTAHEHNHEHAGLGALCVVTPCPRRKH